MIRSVLTKGGTWLALMALALLSIAGRADPALSTSYAVSILGRPALPADFPHFPYANPDAPKGGEVRLAAVGFL